ncbi:hypothetical protein [Pseudomonas sp. NPDC096950]|uniref:hypothetical protein n=1 Tax=Pseudomonas sp. NPDC096950 TaxID=3364485 RepID=UPI00383AA183
MNDQIRKLFERKLREQGTDEAKLQFNGLDYPDQEVNMLFHGYRMAVEDLCDLSGHLIHPAGSKPTTDQIKELRLAAGDSQIQAAQRIYSPSRSWQAFESGEYIKGMPPALWELYQMKVSPLIANNRAITNPAEQPAITPEVET